MNYKKAYKEALERARESMKDGGISQNTIDYLCNIFPELAESDDESIRKDILAFIKRQGQHIDKYKWSKWISWLEKQGDEKPKDKYTFNTIPRLLEMIEPTNRAKSYCQKLIDSLLQEGYTTDAKIVSDCLKQMNGEKVAMATMDEQKPQGKSALEAIKEEKGKSKFGQYKEEGDIIVTADDGVLRTFKKVDNVNKIEPKFKMGDWLVWQNKYYKVNYNGCGYELVDQNGLSTSLEYGTIDEGAHPWSIEDAKDGDVLLFEGYYNSIVLFQGIGINGKGRINYHCKCDLGNYSFGIQGDVACLGTIEKDAENYHPATKEQRNTLFAKMKKAGYEWNEEKKELKKTEQKGGEE